MQRLSGESISVERMNNIGRLKQRIKSIILRSNIPEDPVHAQNSLEWLLKLKPNADEALQIAAFGHDIERALEKDRVKREDFADYGAFKAAHSLNSARILKKMMQADQVQQDITEDVFQLVRHHEIGGDPRSDLIREADSISFFDVNLPFYFEREGREETLRRCRWGYQRLSPETKKIVQTFFYHYPELNSLIKSIL